MVGIIQIHWKLKLNEFAITPLMRESNMILERLIGQTIKITYRDGYEKIQGTLKGCDELFVVIDQGRDKADVFIPLTSILHLQPIQKQ